MSCKTLNLYRILNIRRTLNIRKVLPPLDGRNGTHRVSKARKDKVNGPVLDAEGVTILLSTNIKALRILFSKDLCICLIEED